MNEQRITGYPSIDKPWLRYYTEEIPEKLPNGSMYDYMYKCNEKRQNAVAINYFGNRITYGALNKRISLCRRALYSLGISKEDTVALCMLPVPEIIILFYALNSIGARCCFLPLNATDDELRESIRESESKVVFVSDIGVNRMNDMKINKLISVPLNVSMPSWMRFFVKENKENSAAIKWKDFLKVSNLGKTQSQISHNKNDVACLIYTGGTTGIPKGCEISNEAGNAVAEGYQIANGTLLDIGQGERYLDILPPWLAYGLFLGIHMPLCIGVEVVLSPDPSPEKFPHTFIRYKPNHFSGGPLHLDMLIKNEKVRKMDLSFVKTAAYGGDSSGEDWENSITQELKDRGALYDVLGGYGLTEVSGPFGTKMHRTEAMIPFPRNNIKILNPDTLEELTYGEEGEVFLNGPTLMNGYLGKYNETKETIIVIDGQKWLRTGDLGVVSKDGYFEITGRIKRLFWGRDDSGAIYRIYPMKIESVLSSNKLVEKSAVVGKGDEKIGYRPVAFIVLKNQAEKAKAEKELKDLCKIALQSNSRPIEYHFLEKLPVTRIGKTDFNELERSVSQEYI